tara:strand:- start:127093 stop:127653 length:561 start_codon:yes stop_codon:yes gene_type:complete
MITVEPQRGLELLSGIKYLIHQHPDMDIVQASIPPEKWVRNGPHHATVSVECLLFKRGSHYSIIPIPTLGALLHSSAAKLRWYIPTAPLHENVKSWQPMFFDVLCSVNAVANGKYYFAKDGGFLKVKLDSLIHRLTYKRTATYVPSEQVCMNSLANDWTPLLMKRMEKSKAFSTWVNISLDLCTSW